MNAAPTSFDLIASLQKTGGHKYDHGHLLVIAGDRGRGGAARLAARAALRIGAGLVTLAPTAAAMGEHAGPPDALMREALDDAQALPGIISARRISSIAIGPGCGVARAEKLLPGILATGLPCLLDADALTALAQTPRPLRNDIVLTPHQGEFARLFPDLGAGLSDRTEARRDAALTAARRSGAVVLLKGPLSVIAAPDGRSVLNDASDVPWLATAGSGDVLSGLAAGLLARGFAPIDAAAAAAHIHTESARRFGPGLIADDLIGQIPAVLRLGA